MTNTEQLTTTDDQVTEARGWILDCLWDDEPEALDALTDAQVVRGINRHYVGGWAQFVADQA